MLSKVRSRGRETRRYRAANKSLPSQLSEVLWTESNFLFGARFCAALCSYLDEQQTRPFFILDGRSLDLTKFWPGIGPVLRLPKFLRGGVTSFR